MYKWDEGIVQVLFLSWIRCFNELCCVSIYDILIICVAASSEVRQAYKQFIGAVVELIGGEVVDEEFREVALTVYRIFCHHVEEQEEYRRIKKHR